MKTQQAAEREEQQRIKNLVLNYDLRDGEEQDGDLFCPIPRNPNIHRDDAGIEKAAGGAYARPDKSMNNRSGQRARKLQLSDVDWYAKHNSHVTHENIPFPQSCESFAPKKERSLSKASPNAGRGKLSRRAMLEEHATRQRAANAKRAPFNA
jgi:regulator of nonsense transcripts 2